ncbi:TPA: hypothetical protein ACFPC7_002149, partial [Neisseria meningitidis]
NIPKTAKQIVRIRIGFVKVNCEKSSFLKRMKRLRAEIYADALFFPYFSCVVKVQAALKSVLPSMNHHFALFQRA